MKHQAYTLSEEETKYFGWDTERKCTVYLHNKKPVGSTPIAEAIKLAKAETK